VNAVPLKTARAHSIYKCSGRAGGAAGGAGLGLTGRGNDNDREGETHFHDVVHVDFDEVGAGGFKFDVAKEHHVGGAHGGVAQFEFGFATADDSGLVGRDEADGFGELANACGPAVEDANARGGDGHLRHAQVMNDTDEEEVAVGFLANFFADEGAL